MSNRADWSPWRCVLEATDHEIHERQHLDMEDRYQLRVWARGAVRVLAEGRGRATAYRMLLVGVLGSRATVATLDRREVDDPSENGSCDPIGEGRRDAELVPESISTAAIKVRDVVYTLPRPARHSDVYRHACAEVGGIAVYGHAIEGFVTCRCRFVDRAEAAEIARAARQTRSRTPQLQTVDLW